MKKEEKAGLGWLAVAAGVMIGCIWIGYDMGFDKGWDKSEKKWVKTTDEINGRWQKAFDDQREMTREYKKLLEQEIGRR